MCTCAQFSKQPKYVMIRWSFGKTLGGTGCTAISHNTVISKVSQESRYHVETLSDNTLFGSWQLVLMTSVPNSEQHYVPQICLTIFSLKHYTHTHTFTHTGLRCSCRGLSSLAPRSPHTQTVKDKKFTTCGHP